MRRVFKGTKRIVPGNWELIREVGPRPGSRSKSLTHRGNEGTVGMFRKEEFKTVNINRGYNLE
jgi:hypothetical protein